MGSLFFAASLERGRSALFVLFTALVVLHGDVAQAACNAIPAANTKGPYYSSLTAAIHQPIAVTGERLTVDIGCSTTHVFDSTRADDYLVGLEFLGWDLTKSVDFPAFTPGAAVFKACATDTSCSRYEFEIPDTREANTREHGLAGPVRLTITDKSTNTVVLTIDELHRPVKDCPVQGNLSPDKTFRHLTILPEAPRFLSEPRGPDFLTLLGALDVDGNLLVPFDFTDDLQDPKQPVASLLAGKTKVRSNGGGNVKLLQAVRDNATDPNRQLRSFTLDGRPLPPLMLLGENDPPLVGLVDAENSVLRLQRRDSQTSAELFDLDAAGLIPYDAGPVVMNYRSVNGAKRPVPLLGMRSSKETIAFARDEIFEDTDLDGDLKKTKRLLEVLRVGGAQPSGPGDEVAVRPNGNLYEPVIDVDGAFAVALHPKPDATGTIIQKHVNRFVRNTGAFVGSTDDEASTAPRIDGSPLAISNGRSFYLERSASFDALAVVSSTGPQPQLRHPTLEASVHGDHVVMISPESELAGPTNGDGDKLDDVAFFYWPRMPNECLLSLNVAAEEVAINDEIVVVLVPELADGRRDHNGDGDHADSVVHIWEVSTLVDACDAASTVPAGHVVPYAAKDIEAFGEMAALLVLESEQNSWSGNAACAGTFIANGCDLNNDGDSNDRVLVVGATDGSINPSERATTDYQLGDGFIAFRVSEYEHGNVDRNDDQDTNDDVLHIFFPGCIEMQEVRNTEWSALACNFAGCDPRYPYRALGNMVWFVTDDYQAKPLAVNAVTANRCISDKLFPWRPGGKLKIEPVVDISIGGPLGPFPKKLMGSTTLMGTASNSGLFLAGDQDGDHVPDPYDNCEDRSNADQLDVDRDRLGDRYCDPSPALCRPERPFSPTRCAGMRAPTPAGLCVAEGQSGTEFAWNWQGDVGMPRAQRPGDPIEELPHYSLCVYANDDSGRSRLVHQDAVLPWDECGEPPCWTGSGRSGFAYHRGDAQMPGTIKQMFVPPKRNARDGLYVRGVSERTLDGLGDSLTVQLVARDAGRTRCWSTTHTEVTRGLDECRAPAALLREE